MKKYKFFSTDIVKLKSPKHKNALCYYKVIKDPENIFTTDYELKPWEVYENTINRCWDLNKLKKIKTKHANIILKYWLFRLYRKRRF